MFYFSPANVLAHIFFGPTRPGDCLTDIPHGGVNEIVDPAHDGTAGPATLSCFAATRHDQQQSLFIWVGAIHMFHSRCMNGVPLFHRLGAIRRYLRLLLFGRLHINNIFVPGFCFLLSLIFSLLGKSRPLNISTKCNFVSIPSQPRICTIHKLSW